MQRKNRKSAVLRPTRIAIAVGATFLSSQAAWADPAANQLPTGGSVAAGTVSISTNGSKMQIDQASDKAILNWQNFSIGSSGWVNFSQPSSSSVALNRSMQPAEIFGRLSANGRVFITSQAGVYFARSAQVDVGALVATNLSIRDQDFLAGRYVFSNEGSSGSVTNEGTIITPGGYAALAGTQVRNNGIIVAQAGTVALAAGDRVTLDMVGDGLIRVSVDAAALNALALNSGTLQADGGRVILTARAANALLDTVINNTGVIRARSLVERNGEIVLDGGSAGVVAHSGTIDASSGAAGTTGGGVSVSGQYVALADSSTTNASGDAGGGTVTIKATDAAFVYGAISARDEGGNGRGGSVETSGKYLEVTQAPDVGAGGTWLIDPYNIDVVAVAPPPGFSNNTGPTTFTPIGDSSQIAASLITSQLNAGTNVVLDTGGAGSPGTQAGDIRVLAGIDKTVPNPASLTLKAFHDVQVNQPISIASTPPGPGGFGTLTIEAGHDVVVAAPISTPGGGLRITADGFTNQAAINNGVGGGLLPGMSITANRFDLATGTINGGLGSVGLFAKNAGNSFGIESSGDTTVTNADIASITTSPDTPATNANQLLFGAGAGGSMRIGANAQVNGGGKNLMFFASGVTIGSNGVTTTGDVRVDAGAGAIGGTGTVGGNRVALSAGSIGTGTARVGTAANTLAARGTSGSVFLAEADNVTLGSVTLAGLTSTNGVAPGNAYDLVAGGNVAINGVVAVGGRLNLGAGGALNLGAAGVQDSQLISSGGQTISAAALAMNAQDGRRAVIQNGGGNQSLAIGAGGMNLNVVAGAGVAQIANNTGSGTQTVTTSGAISIVGGSAAPSTNSGIFQNQTGKQTVTAGSISLQGALTGNTGGAFVSNTAGGGDQEVNVAGGSITIAGGASGTANRAGIVTNGNQTINGNPDISLTGGSSGAGTGAASNAVFIQTGGAGKQQIINAGTISVTAGTGGTDTSATITAGKQTITTTGDVLISGGGGGGDANGARIGGLGGAIPGATDLKLTVGRDLKISGGSANGASVGSTVAAATPHAIDISAGRDVILEASDAAPVRIGTSFNFTPATGDIKVAAGRDIRLSGTAAQQAAIRTASNVELGAGGTISQNFNGLVLGTRLKASSGGDLVLTGPNAITSFDGTSTGGNVSVVNTRSLDILNVATPASASIVVTGDITESGSIQAGSLATSSTGATTLAGVNQIGTFTGSSGSDLTLHNASSMVINGPVSSTGALVLDVDGTLSIRAAGTQDAVVHSFGGQTITARAVEVSARDGRTASLWNTGPSSQSITASNGAGVDVVVSSGGGFAQIQADAGSSQSVTVVDGDHINVNGATGTASIVAFNTAQTLSITGSGANAITMGSNGAMGGSFAHGSMHQSVTAGNAGESGSITIVGPGANATLSGLYDNPNAGGTQTISTSGIISITGGSAPSQPSNFFTGIAHNGSGQQTISAGGITMTGGQSGNGNGVTIGSFGGGVSANAGAQLIDVGGGSISVTGGTGGNANTALINALRDQTILAGGTISVSGGTVGVANRAGIVAGGNQIIGGGADIVVTGGSSGGAAGNGNNAFINTNGGIGTQQTVNAASLNLLSGTGGIDNSASMGARKQVITVDGDVNLTGRASGGTLGGVRLGGLGGAVLTDTDLTLTLNNGGNLTLTGGSVPGNVASIGSGVGTGPLSNTIAINAAGNVVLNAGSTSARIGNAASAPDSGGDISIGAASIQLNGTGSTPTLIRTAGNVTLSTSGPGGISEGSNGFVQAGSLSITSMNGPANLSGPNRVGTLDVLAMGSDLTFNNSGALNLRNVLVTGNLLAPGNATITNAGDVSVTNSVNSSGMLTMNIAGALKLDADATHDAFVVSNGQTINAQSLSVTSRDGRTALLLNQSGDQAVSITGGNVDIALALPVGIAQVSSAGNQSIAVTNGDHINVDGTAVFAGGNQSLSITGSGANAINVGTMGTARGSVLVAGRNQTVTAGTGAQNGSITITGPAASGTGISGFVTSSGVGTETQTISTSGTLRVTGGTAPAQLPNFNSGIFHNRQGQQTITATDIVVEGGASGSNNSAFIATNGPNVAGPGGGDQVIHVTGTMTLRGSDAGFNNRAIITSNRSQTIDGNPDISITAGSAGGLAGLGNTAGISTAPGQQQTIRAGTLRLTSGAGGIDATAFVSGGVQDIQTTGDLLITGGGSGGTRGAALIGGPGGGAVLQPTNLTLRVGQDLILTGGSAEGDAASIGSSALGTGTPSNEITITAGRDVILNSGSGAGARIGTSILVAPTDGHLSIAAGRNIELNGTAQPTVIRTAGSVALHAGGTISEAVNGFVVASTLDTTSGGAQNLVGPNQVSRFTASAASGDVTLRNSASVLTLGNMDLSGSLSIDQAGALAVPGTVSALNQAIQATGDVTVGGASGGLAGLFSLNAMTIGTPQSVVLRGSDSAFAGASLVAAGGLVTMNVGELHLTGGAAPLAAASVLGGDLMFTSARNITLTSGSGWGSNALAFSASNIRMTVGGNLFIDGGHTPSNWARVQTATRDGTITLEFPNESSGGFFVDGFEGKIKHGQDGFFTGTKPAKLGDTLLLIYGL